MRKQIKPTCHGDLTEVPTKRIAAILADGVSAYLKGRGLLREGRRPGS